jgi:acetyl esterase/lipase
MRVRTMVASICSGMLLTGTAHSQEVINLWPQDAIPNAIQGLPSKERTELGQDGILRIYNVFIPTLTAYVAPGDKASGVGVMICPGGGYSFLAAGHEGAEVAHWFNELGVTAFVLNYRLPDDANMTNQQEVPLLDAMQGMALIRQNAARYNLDPDQIGVLGFSAGGHLAATLATHYHRGPQASEQAKPNFAMLVYPVITFGEKAHTGSRDKLLGKLNASPNLITYYSTELQVTHQTPPTFLVHSQDDKTVPVENSLLFYLACLKSGIPAELHLYPTGGHGYGLRTANFGSLNGWPTACKVWLETVTNK